VTSFYTNWNAEIGGNGWGNNELQYYTNNSNSRLENGSLIIEARKESVGGMLYTSSRLLSKKSFKYGIFEMSAKLPRGIGTWPAFWLLGDKRPINWPADGEIDVMEHVGYDPNIIHGSIHCQKYYHKIGTQKTAQTAGVDNAFDKYHNYTLVWTSNKIEVSFDNLKYFSYVKESNSTDSWPFDNGFNIILNLAIGGDWGGAQGVDNTVFPAKFNIDYVRQYEYVEPLVG
jgi:beta-glucanase (GH16 family)